MTDKYFHLLKTQFPSKEAVLTEITNLSAICELPKGTEHFVSDIHGEYAAFNHVLRNGAGSIKEKIKECFPAFNAEELTEFATLIYYPKEKLAQLADRATADWYQLTIPRLVQVARLSGRKYTRSKIRKALPEKFAYIIDELLHEAPEKSEKKDYFDSIIQKVISLGQAADLVEALADLTRRLIVDHVHVVGDIYDRGPYPDLIMDRLIHLPSVDIQWGNHDIIWMGIMAGSSLAMMNVLRVSARYGNLDIVEKRYGVRLRSFIDYAQHYYHASPAFAPRLLEQQNIAASEKEVLNCVQQAAMILQLKLESQLIQRQPEFHLHMRDVLTRIDYKKSELHREEKSYPLVDFQTPTVDATNPSALTAEEKELVSELLISFQSSEKLKRHINFLAEKGGMYLCYNDNLLIHGCMPLHENGDFKSFKMNGQSYFGRKLLDFFEKEVRRSLKNPNLSEDLATDLFWYLWVGETSPLFGKAEMTTFERYYIQDKTTHIEKKNPYYKLRDNVEVVQNILKEFDLPETGHIINGHTPVKAKDGETPIKAQGQMLVIDGGFSKPYQKETGIAGYTLLYNSYGLQLVAHQAFRGVEAAVKEGTDIISLKRLVERADTRKKVKDTNIGKGLQETIADLEELYNNYQKY